MRLPVGCGNIRPAPDSPICSVHCRSAAADFLTIYLPQPDRLSGAHAPGGQHVEEETYPIGSLRTAQAGFDAAASAKAGSAPEDHGPFESRRDASAERG